MITILIVVKISPGVNEKLIAYWQGTTFSNKYCIVAYLLGSNQIFGMLQL